MKPDRLSMVKKKKKPWYATRVRGRIYQFNNRPFVENMLRKDNSVSWKNGTRGVFNIEEVFGIISDRRNIFVECPYSFMWCARWWIPKRRFLKRFLLRPRVVFKCILIVVPLGHHCGEVFKSLCTLFTDMINKKNVIKIDAEN